MGQKLNRIKSSGLLRKRSSVLTIAAVIAAAIVFLSTGLVATSSASHEAAGATAGHRAKTTGQAKVSASTVERRAILSELKSSNLHSESKLKISSLVSELLPSADTEQALQKFENEPGMPTCAAPTPPAATYPPNGTYGIPFVAAITNGQILTSYSEWVADHHVYNVGGTNYTLDPWDVRIWNITGWVTGLLTLPQLSASVPASGVTFCDTNNQNCPTATYTASQCINLSQLFPGPGTQGSELTNTHPEGTPCMGYSGGSAGFPYPCVPYIITLTPATTDTKLTVTGVESNGSLDLSVSTGAFATISLNGQTCDQTSPTSLTLSTITPTSLPAGAPIAPTAGNPDERSMQTTLSPLTGPLSSATATLGTNNFQIPAWGVPPTASCPDPGIEDTLNGPAGGYNVHDDQIYVDQAPIASQYGWSQFSVTTTVATLGLQVGPPSNFNF